MWRALQSAIPCRSILANKHLKINPSCPACNQGPDDIRHMLFECKLAMNVWKMLGLELVIKQTLKVDKAGELVLAHLLCLPEQQIQVLGLPKFRETMATTAWYLWYERRKLTHDEETQSAYQINMSVRGLVENYTISYSPKAHVRSDAWLKPKYGYVKLNVDAGFDSDTLAATFGAVIRDHRGKFIAAANEKMDLCFDSFTAEAIAVRFGLNLANTVGCSKVEVNSDSVKVVNALSQGYSSSVASSIIDDCYFMSLGFSHVIYDHCNRERNRVAHELARLARFSSPSVWMDNAPNEVIPLLVNDATLLMNE